jgi:hypothetical protein
MSDLQDIIAHTAQKAYQEGLRREREGWLSRLERIRTWNPDSHEAFLDGVIHEQQRIVKLIEDTYSDAKYQELGSIEFTGDIVALIKGEQK